MRERNIGSRRCVSQKQTQRFGTTTKNMQKKQQQKRQTICPGPFMYSMSFSHSIRAHINTSCWRWLDIYVYAPSS